MNDTSPASGDAQAISIILFKIGGLLSMIGSLLILRDVWMKFKEKKEISLTATLIFELSLCDFFSSLFGPFLGTWMVPKETGAYLAAGTTASCTAQGFLANTFYTASVFCNATLATAYCLIVKKGWKDSCVNNNGNWLLRSQPLVSLLIASAPLFDNAYNYAGVSFCGVKSFPLGCELENSGVECTRGLHEIRFKFMSFFILFAVNVIIIASILMLIHSVWVIEKKMNNYYARGNINQSHSLKATWQGICYIAAFVMAWWPFIIYHITEIVTSRPPIFLKYFHSITWPSQGAFNAIVYFRPRYKSDRERHGTDTRLSSVRRTLRLPDIHLVLFHSSEGSSDSDCLPKTSGGDSDTVVKREKDVIAN